MDDPESIQSGRIVSDLATERRALVMRFESLGGSGHGCEFGLFQRHFDAEPLGLLRWADLGHDLLIKALETRFEGVGQPENTIVFNPDGTEEWWTRDTRFWMAMRSFVKVADVDLETMQRQVCRRLQFLRSKMIEDLQAGEKIFVYKNLQRNLTDSELRRLHAAVRAYGDPTLFTIQYADAAHPSGTVEAREPGLLVGYIDHFAFSPDDKPLGSANEQFYVLCERAFEIFAGATPSARSSVPLPTRKRRVAVIGNCQAQAMMSLYQKFVTGRTGETLTYVTSYADLTPDDRATIEQADLIVEQLFDLKQQADTAGVAANTPRLFIPMVTAGFLWPFAGQAHPRNTPTPFLVEGPYGGEAGDSYLNRLILAGTDPEEAVKSYLALDVSTRTNLDRMYELIMDRQRSRDEAAGYRIADVIEQHFRTEQIFLTPYHPNTRVAVALATRFFQQMGADRDDIERMQTGTRRPPFPKTELPLHPSVCKHFGMEFVTPERRYRYMNEGLFTFREYALRYMRYEWNEDLEAGISLVHAGKRQAATEKLVTGLARSPKSASGHSALSVVLADQNRIPDAVTEASRAVAIEPDFSPHRAQLGMLLRQQGLLDEAETELQAAVADDPTEQHNLLALAHVLRQRGRIAQACALVRSAIALDPYAAKLHAELAGFLEAADDVKAAVTAQQQAVALAATDAAGLLRLAHLYGRLGQMEPAADVARRAGAIDPNDVRPRIALSDILLRQGKPQEALMEALMAAVLDPDNAQAYSNLGHVLQQNGDPAAEPALRRAARLDPDNAHVRHQLSDLFIALDRLDEAIIAAGEATTLEPGNPHRFVHLSRLFLKANDMAEAIEAQRRAVMLSPNDAPMRVVLSDLLARQGRRQEALDEARLAVEHQPHSAHALGHLAHVLQLMGALEDSEALFRQALDIAPHNDHLHAQLAAVRSRRLQAVTA